MKDTKYAKMNQPTRKLMFDCEVVVGFVSFEVEFFKMKF